GLGRHLPFDVQLVDRDAQDDAVHLSHLLQLPVLGSLAEDCVQLLLIGDHPMYELTRERSHLRGGRALIGVVAQDFVRVVVRAFQLEEDPKRELSRLVALPCGPAAAACCRQLLKATLAMTSLATRTAPRVAASPIRETIRCQAAGALVA